MDKQERRLLVDNGSLKYLHDFDTVEMTLYGDQSLSYEAKRSILTLTITYILKTERLD